MDQATRNQLVIDLYMLAALLQDDTPAPESGDLPDPSWSPAERQLHLLDLVRMTGEGGGPPIDFRAFEDDSDPCQTPVAG